MTIKVGINGFGRIGRNVLRAAVQNFGDDIEIVAINDLLEPDYLAYMLKYDSVHGRFDGDVAVDGGHLLVNGKKIRLTQERDPANLKWDEVKADVVIESTGLFLTKEAAQKQREFARLFYDVFMTGRGPELLSVMRESTIELDLMAVSPVIMNGMREMGVGPAEWAYHRNGQNSVVRWIETMIRLSQAVETEEQNDV